MQTDPLIGQTIGDFIIQDRLGAGGMATVYRAKQTSVNRDVALKVIDFKQASLQPDFQRRFAQEAEFIASLEHIHILPVYSYGIQGDTAYLSMRLLRGSLKELLQDGAPLPMDRAVAIFRQVAKGLAYAHSRGIVHRDIKPANVLLDENGNAYLSDFGLAKSLKGSDLTQADIIVGTLTYMSPEQLRGERLDQRTDVYSMGIMLYEMLAGRPPFSGELGEDLIGIMYKHLEAVPPSLKAINPLISHQVEEVVMKALEKDRAARFFDMGEMVRALDHAIGSSASSGFYPVAASTFRNAGSGSSATIGAPHLASASPRNPRTLLAVLLIILLTAGLAVAAFLLSRPQFSGPHTIRVGESVEWTDLIPSDRQISLARQRLGADGFIALVMCNQTSEYHTTITREISTHLRGYGLATRVYDSRSDGYEQRLRFEEALTAQAKGFIVCPLDIEQIRQPLQAIDEANLPLAAFTPFDQNYGGVYTSQQGGNYDMGQKVGRYAGRFITEQRNGQARVVILGFPEMQSVVERANGLRDGLLETAPQAQIVAEVVGGTRDFGRDSVAKLLNDGLDFNAILSINDAGSLGAVEALEAASVPYDAVDIFSVDAEELALRYIRDGRYLRGSLEVGRANTAQAVSDAMVRMLAGETLAEIIRVPLGDMIDSSALSHP